MEMNQAVEGDDINIYQINERKLWEQRCVIMSEDVVIDMHEYHLSACLSVCLSESPV